jgi:hypothetical protein
VLCVQVTLLPGTAPFKVGELKLQVTVRTKVPPVPLAFAGWKTVITALVNARSVIVSVHFEFGHSGAPVIGFGVGAFVTTWNGTLPFLSIDEEGMNWPPLTVVGAGFCPGG